MCVGKIDFNNPNAMAEVDVCTLKAKHFLQQRVLVETDCVLSVPEDVEYEFERQVEGEVGTITIDDYAHTGPCAPTDLAAVI